jgi:uncharacterized protein (DUF58 family)
MWRRRHAADPPEVGAAAIDLIRLDRLARRVRIGRAHRGIGVLAGPRPTPHRGHGLSFVDHREYAFGDDVRHFDWRVTARLARPFVKRFQQDRSGTVLVLADASASIRAGGSESLRTRMLEAAALVILMAAHAQERVGAAMFTDRIEWLWRPRRGRRPAVAAIRAMDALRLRSRGTSLTTALAQADRALASAATVVIISDFIDRGYERALTTLRRRHDVLAIRLRRPLAAWGDRRPGGLLRVRDPESGRTRWLDTSSPRVAAHLAAAQRTLDISRRALFDTIGVPCFDLDDDHPPERLWMRVGARL